MRRPAILAAVLLAAVTAPAGAAVKKLTFQVPVTVPDDTGAKVLIDTDVYLPEGRAPKGGRPFIEVFHGGGSDKANEFDAGHAKYFAEHGYVSMIYSQRGHGASGGLTAVAGPNEMRDLFDVTHWALGQKFGIDRRRIALTGYSQGGLSTNIAQASIGDKDLDPYGIRFAALEPGNTPDYIAQALVPNGVAKLSVGVGLIETYAIGAHAHVTPLMGKWFSTIGADQLYASGSNLCDTTAHDTFTGTTLADFAVRSIGCNARRMTPPVLWAQAFDDAVFPSSMALHMWRRMPNHAANRLYLSMGGHAAASAPPAVEKDKLRVQLAYFDHYLKGTRLRIPRVIYWIRDPNVKVPADAFRYPAEAWLRRTATRWPPVGMGEPSFGLGADGVLAASKPAAGTLPLSGAQPDPGSDAVLQAAFSATPLGANPAAPAAVGTSLPGVVAGFATPAFVADREMSGDADLHLAWTPIAPDTQLAAKLYDQAPDRTLTLLGRAVRGLRNATPGQQRTLNFETNAFSVLVRKDHRVVLTITAGDASYYKPFAGSTAGGTLAAGEASSVTLPLRLAP